MPPTNLINAIEIEKSIPSRILFSQVSCSIDSGERIGLVGNNGCGKSSFVRILTGNDTPDRGQVVRNRELRLGYFEQNPQLKPGKTALEVTLEGCKEWLSAWTRYEEIGKALESGHGDAEALAHEQAEQVQVLEQWGGWDLRHRAQACLDRFDIRDSQRQVEHMSGGEKRRVALARLLVAPLDLIIFDEPTNHLDLPAIEGLESWLVDQFKGAVLLVTHDRRLLDEVVQYTWEIDHGHLYSYRGGWQEFLIHKAERQAHLARQEANRQNFLRREIEWLSRQPKARSVKQRARVDRAEAALSQSKPVSEKSSVMIASSSQTGKTILEVEDLSVSRSERTLVQNLTLRLQPGQCIGLVGPNGCGKTSLVRVLLGLDEPSAGKRRTGKNLKIAYLDQMRASLDESATIKDAIAKDRNEIQLGKQSLSIRNYLERFLFRYEDHHRRVSTLSGGERARLALAQILGTEANLIVLDEPTNDLDVTTLGALEACLVDFSGTTIIVTHDRWILDRIATQILAFTPSGQLDYHEGNYSSYANFRVQRAANSESNSSTSSDSLSNKAANTSNKSKKSSSTTKKGGLSFTEKNELKKLTEEIEIAESELQALESQLNSDQFYQLDHEQQTEFLNKLESLKQRNQGRLQRWEELEEKSLCEDS